MIPKIIHYCWFGHNPLSSEAKRCIASWKKYCPDYEIKEWNESNFDIDCCVYVREAYQAQKWAFVSDYARMLILYRNGGLYFDTDVELIRPIDDLREQGSFMGVEECRYDRIGKVTQLTVNPGLGLGAEAGNAFLCVLLDGYHKRHFKGKNGTLDQSTVVEFTTKHLMDYGMKWTDQIQKVADITLYPKDYFCPVDYHTGEMTVTENTRSIHHYSETWLDPHTRRIHARQRALTRCFGRKLGALLGSFLVLDLRLGRKLAHIKKQQR